MTSTDRRTRQYRVTHIPTGIVTVVNATIYVDRNGRSKGYYEATANAAGLRWGTDACVSLVPEGQEIPLPWGCLPLVLRPRVV